MVSSEAPRLERMCGNATLAMVTSRNCMTDTPITASISTLRCRVSSAALSSMRLLAGVDPDIHRQSRDQVAPRLALDGDAHGHALRHLDPVGIGVLRRQH